MDWKSISIVLELCRKQYIFPNRRGVIHPDQDGNMNKYEPDCNTFSASYQTLITLGVYIQMQGKKGEISTSQEALS